VLAVALEYASKGFAVHPVYGVRDGSCTCHRRHQDSQAGKHPVFASWTTLATTDPDTIRSWDWTDRNIGVVPRGFCILDFDGEEGLRLLDNMSALLPELPDTTPIVVTGSGGYHIYIAGDAPTRTRLLPGFDIRGIGGQAVLPPSAHYSGGQYRWLTAPTTPPEAPEWLEVARGTIPDELQPEHLVTADDLKALAKGKWKSTWKAVIAGEPFAKAGERNKTLFNLVRVLAGRYPYVNPQRVVEFFRPSLESMQSVEGAPTEDQLVSMVQRCCAMQREELSRKPRIQITTDIEDMVVQGIQALAKSDLQIYTRAGRIVRVRPPEHIPDGVLRGETPPRFQEVVRENLMAHLTTAAAWYRETAEGPKNAKPPTEVLARISERGEWPELLHAERIIEGPMLRPDGSLFHGGAYDPYTGVISLGEPDTEPLPAAEEALAMLLDVVSDFPFASDAHRSGWLASLLTSVAQPIFRGPCPMFLIDANTKSAGKTMLAEASILIASGKSPARITVGRDTDEDRKQITSHAKRGSQCLLTDNVKGSFGTGVLCEALTLQDSTWTDRILGKTNAWSGPFKPTWWATANNIRLEADMPRRVCYIRLDCPMEDPSLRSGFAKPSLMMWVQDHRSALYRAVLALLHQYIQAGRPQAEIAPWGSYEAWSSLIRQTIVWLGLPDPADTREELVTTDEEHELVELLIQGLHELELDELTPSTIHALLYGTAQTMETLSKYGKLREAFEMGCSQKGGTPTPQSIGRLLKRFRGRVIGDLRLQKLPRKGSYWRVGKNDKNSI
jgi:hypothetical protein